MTAKNVTHKIVGTLSLAICGLLLFYHFAPLSTVSSPFPLNTGSIQCAKEQAKSPHNKNKKSTYAFLQERASKFREAHPIAANMITMIIAVAMLYLLSKLIKTSPQLPYNRPSSQVTYNASDPTSITKGIAPPSNSTKSPPEQQHKHEHSSDKRLNKPVVLDEYEKYNLFCDVYCILHRHSKNGLSSTQLLNTLKQSKQYDNHAIQDANMLDELLHEDTSSFVQLNNRWTIKDKQQAPHKANSGQQQDSKPAQKTVIVCPPVLKRHGEEYRTLPQLN